MLAIRVRLAVKTQALGIARTPRPRSGEHAQAIERAPKTGTLVTISNEAGNAWEPHSLDSLDSSQVSMMVSISAG